MILLDTIFINNGGGKILMDYLYRTLRNQPNEEFVVLIDERLKSEYNTQYSENIKKVYLNGLLNRNKYYKIHKNSFTAVLCFGNIPPPIRLNAKVYTYFHQRIYLSIPKSFSYKERFKFFLKVQILRKYIKNCDYWLVQSVQMGEALAEKFKIKNETVLKIPFYPSFNKVGVFEKKKNSFIYVSNASPHKNHILLINAFCKFYDVKHTGSLVLTVDIGYLEIYNLIRQKIESGYPIKNLGFINREELYQHYQSAEYLIYPSLSESFGLGIIEAVANGCKVVGADLPYLHEVCDPSIVFNPLDQESIYKSFFYATDGKNIPPTILRTSDQIDELIRLITSDYENSK